MFMPDCNVGQLDEVNRPLQSLLPGHGGDDGVGGSDHGGWSLFIGFCVMFLVSLTLNCFVVVCTIKLNLSCCP